MRRPRGLLISILSIALLMAYMPAASAAPTYYVRNTAPYDSDENFDGQAYYASRYVPSLRPKVVLGSLLLIGILVVILQNSNNSGHVHT